VTWGPCLDLYPLLMVRVKWQINLDGQRTVQPKCEVIISSSLSVQRAPEQRIHVGETCSLPWLSSLTAGQLAMYLFGCIAHKLCLYRWCKLWQPHLSTAAGPGLSSIQYTFWPEFRVQMEYCGNWWGYTCLYKSSGLPASETFSWEARVTGKQLFLDEGDSGVII
jgi:hypothetical protein